MTTDERIKVKTTVRFKPWNTPNYAHMDTGGAETTAILVADLSPEALDALALTWLDHLFSGVGRPTPFTKRT